MPTFVKINISDEILFTVFHNEVHSRVLDSNINLVGILSLSDY